jgi:hypothetical protein
MTELSNVVESEKNRKSLSIMKETYDRLSKHGHWSESADHLINRLLDERENSGVEF